jgi:putative DNA methylase
MAISANDIPILARVDWAAANRLTRHQVRNRELYCPPISLFRWWARRPHPLAGALLEASRLRQRDLVSDPFSGGGTVTIEALVRGYRVYAQDLNPWPTWGLQTALDGVSPDLLESEIDSYWKSFRRAVFGLYAADCPDHGMGEILHTFWVRECTCNNCRKTLFLFPYSLITLASRNQDETTAFYGCSACGQITRARTSRRASCDHCGRLLAPARQPLLARKLVRCPHCSREISYRVAWSGEPKWMPVLVQRYCVRNNQKHVHFDVPTAREKNAALTRVESPQALLDKIPPGRETATLRRGGFKRCCDLYPPRQISVLSKAADLVQGGSSDKLVRRRIQLAIAGAAEMAGYLCRWDRFHPKPFEALANHRYAVLGLAVETNLAAERGRGTLKRRLNSSLKAARWTQEQIPLRRTAQSAREDGDGLPYTIVTGNSARQRIASNSVRLVITDPPYFDAVQYGELSGLFLTWARIVTGRQRLWKPNLRFEALPNEIRRASTSHYERMLRSILRETARTMRSSARLLLTYHSTDFRGWVALGRALHTAGLRVVALAVAHSENEKDHPKRNSNVFSTDLVIECQKRGRCVADPLVVTFTRKSDQRELLAAGCVIAKLGHAEYKEIAKEYLDMTKRLRSRRIRVPLR